MEPKTERRTPKAEPGPSAGCSTGRRSSSPRRARVPAPRCRGAAGHALGCKRIDLYTRYEEPATEEERGQLQGADPPAARRLPGGVPGRPQGVLLAGVRGRPRRAHPAAGQRDAGRRMPAPGQGRCPSRASSTSAPARATSPWPSPGSHKGAQVTAIDVSPEALAVARRNAAKHGVAERIRFLHGDLFAPMPCRESASTSS